MRIGWRTFLKQKLRTKSAFHAVGIAVAHEVVTACLLKRESGRLVVVQEQIFNVDKWPEQLSKWVDSQNIGPASCHVAFSIDYYQLLQIDRPPVEDNELKDALLFPIKEISGSDGPFLFDYIDLPVPLAGSKKVNVAAIPNAHVETVIEAVINAGLCLKSISVAEIVTCDLVETDKDPLLMLIQEAGEEISLNVVKDGQLYVSRRLKGFENLGSFSRQELQMGLADSLSVQVQRSMDYFESQLRQPPIRNIAIRLDTPHADVLANLIGQSVNATVSGLALNVESESDGDTSRLNLVALGAAMASNNAKRQKKSKKEVAE